MKRNSQDDITSGRDSNSQLTSESVIPDIHIGLNFSWIGETELGKDFTIFAEDGSKSTESSLKLALSSGFFLKLFKENPEITKIKSTWGLTKIGINEKDAAELKSQNKLLPISIQLQIPSNIHPRDCQFEELYRLVDENFRDEQNLHHIFKELGKKLPGYLTAHSITEIAKNPEVLNHVLQYCSNNLDGQVILDIITPHINFAENPNSPLVKYFPFHHIDPQVAKEYLSKVDMNTFRDLFINDSSYDLDPLPFMLCEE